jgi:hypothetical protein
MHEEEGVTTHDLGRKEVILIDLSLQEVVHIILVVDG